VSAASAYDRLVDALHKHGAKVKANGVSAKAQCPAHEDRNPSLSLRPIEGQALVHCFAGCDTADVLATLGLEMSALYDEPTGARYDYTDRTGTVLRSVHRTPSKKFRQTGHTKGTAPLYRLPQVVGAVALGATVYVVEGEADVHALESLGAVATTSPMGAGNAAKADWTPLTGAHVVIVPDRDKAGAKYATDVAALLDGLAASVTVALPKVGNDPADHVAAGQGLDDLVPVEPATATLDVVTASDVELRRVAYLWDRRIPIGAITLLPGEEGIGKTTVGIRLMADLTRGWLPGEHHGTPRHVVVVATEDGIADVFVPRLKEAGADLTRVHIVRARVGPTGDRRDVIVPLDLGALSATVRKHDAALVWIDSLVTTLPDELKTISYKDTATVLKRLGGWAETERVAVAAPWHLNKAHGSDTAVRIMDSRAFRTAVRSMLLIVADPDADEGVTQGLVALDKANAGPLAVPAMRYRIRSAPYEVTELDEATGELRDVAASCGVADWIGSVAGDGRELARSYLVPKVEKENDSKVWLRDYLDDAGEALRSDVIAAASQGGFSRAAIERAAAKLPVHSREETGRNPDTGRPWRRSWWSLSAKSPHLYHTRATEGTEGTREGSSEVIDVVSTGQGKSPQFPQSPPCRESEGTGQSGEGTGAEPDATGAETTELCPRDRDLFSADYAPASTPATPAPCRVCGVEMTPERAGQYDRYPCRWSAMLAAQPDAPGRMGVVTPMPNHVDHVNHVETRGTG